MLYLYDMESGVFIGTWNPPLNVRKTLAIKKSIFKNVTPPPNTTKLVPPSDPGKCWFIKSRGQWQKKDPNKIESKI